MKFEAETHVSSYSPHQWINKLETLGFSIESIDYSSIHRDWSIHRRKASLKTEFEFIHQLKNFVLELGTSVKIEAGGGGVFKILIKDR